jgi:murein DD-endopeptidase MepM/ murein hydrolase activator NlpD
MPRDTTPPRRFSARREKRYLLWVIFLVAMCTALGIKLSGGYLLAGDPTGWAAGENTPQSATPMTTTRGSLKQGETISSLLGGLFSPREIHELALVCNKVYPLRSICAGRSYRISLAKGDFRSFACDIDDDEQLVVTRDKDGFSVSRDLIPYATKLVTIQGTIESSLFEAMVKTGESESLALRLADIFAWDIDFFHDIQPGDTFEVVVEKRSRDGQPAGDGRLLAARFTSQGQLCQAFYFKDGSREPDYYDENGRSLRKAFLKAPLSFSRISSGFNMHRHHPITHRIEAHPAIDFAAPAGTPIHTVGDGTVLLAAYKHYNGRCVKVRHPNGWVTMYNHMSRFGKDIKAGRKVRQGQVIGYVGSTGRSTGPHLDYRLYRNGVPVNPLKVKSPPARPVSPVNLASFKTMVAEREAFMNEKPEKVATLQVLSQH